MLSESVSESESEFESGSEKSQVGYDVEEKDVSDKEAQVEHNIEEKAVSDSSDSEENQTEGTEEQETEKNNEHEVEQELHVQDTTNTKKRSWVWDYFVYDKTMKKAKCTHCNILIACKKGSTSGMANHINNKHKIAKGNGKKQLIIDETINNSKVNQVIVSIIFIF